MRFYEHVDPNGNLKEKFMHRLRELGVLSRAESSRASVVSPAQIQALFLYHKEDPKNAIAEAQQLVPRDMDMLGETVGQSG